MSDRIWSAQQLAIFDWFENGKGNLLVRARAGTGKTTTICEGISRAPENAPLLAAFNKRIAVELQAKLSANPRAKAQTLHSVGFQIVRKYWPGVKPDEFRGDRIAQIAAGGEKAPEQMVRLVKKLASIAKSVAPLAIDSPIGHRTLVDLAYDYECVPDEEWEEDGWNADAVARCALEGMKMACERGSYRTIDFDDMVYLPLANQWGGAKYDLVVIDECQDMNASQIMLARKVLRAGGRVCVVGDDRQSIYSFRGADSGSLDRLKKELNAVELPLTVTYRCGKAIVAVAAKLVPDFEAAPSAPKGEIKKCSPTQLTALAEPGDFVLSRKNSALMGACLGLLKAGKRAKIEGKDIGKQLLNIVRKLSASTIPEVLARLEEWKRVQVKRASANPHTADERIDAITDQAEAISALAEDLATTAELEERIASLFEDDVEKARTAMIVCSSIHRAKGLEAERVFVLTDTLKVGKDQEEDNIAYVAYTRVKLTLFLVVPGAQGLSLVPSEEEKKPEAAPVAEVVVTPAETLADALAEIPVTEAEQYMMDPLAAEPAPEPAVEEGPRGKGRCAITIKFEDGTKRIKEAR